MSAKTFFARSPLWKKKEDRKNAHRFGKKGVARFDEKTPSLMLAAPPEKKVGRKGGIVYIYCAPRKGCIRGPTATMCSVGAGDIENGCRSFLPTRQKAQATGDRIRLAKSPDLYRCKPVPITKRKEKQNTRPS